MIREGQQFLVSLVGSSLTSVRFEGHGTGVSIQSDLGLDLILEIGASCVPA